MARGRGPPQLLCPGSSGGDGWTGKGEGRVEGFPAEEHDRFVTDWWGRVEEESQSWIFLSLTNKAESVWWRTVVTRGDANGGPRFIVSFLTPGTCIQSVTWWLGQGEGPKSLSPEVRHQSQ